MKTSWSENIIMSDNEIIFIMRLFIDILSDGNKYYDKISIWKYYYIVLDPYYDKIVLNGIF